MGDGTNLGIDAERALKTILGGEPSPGEAEQQTPEQVRARVEAAKPTSYSGATDCLTRAVLRLFAEREDTQVWPTDPGYDTIDGKFQAVGPNLFDAAKGVATPDEAEAFDGCTGFMWGFAVNQARWILGQHPGANPAIVELGGD
jgi:hypothetical protein